MQLRLVLRSIRPPNAGLGWFRQNGVISSRLVVDWRSRVETYQSRRHRLADELTNKVSLPVPSKRPILTLPVLSQRSRAKGWGGFYVIAMKNERACTSAIIISAQGKLLTFVF